jgi:hypothetical protein
MKTLDPTNTLVIQALRKPLSFKEEGWAFFDKEKAPKGNILITDSSAHIVAAMQGTKRKIIVLDDFQYTMANEFMRRSHEKGYDRFNDIGKNAWDILNAAGSLADDVRVYILTHTSTDDFGKVKIKTVGKMLDDKITPEGMFSIVLRAVKQDGQYRFTTQNSGNDTVKSPEGMFSTDTIENDLKQVDDAICNFYNINTAKAA